MRLKAKQVDADRRQARAYADDALREAVCRWIVDNKASRARTARASVSPLSALVTLSSRR
jgi:hypothetical protein